MNILNLGQHVFCLAVRLVAIKMTGGEAVVYLYYGVRDVCSVLLWCGWLRWGASFARAPAIHCFTQESQARATGLCPDDVFFVARLAHCQRLPLLLFE